jgi:L-alanine-DL-glutamate epimerase-like enolase superfamily enzyme
LSYNRQIPLEQIQIGIMKISRILVYCVDLPLKEGTYSFSGGRSIRSYDSTVVRIETDEGLVGYGEVCPLGPAYLPAYAAGVRTGIAELGPHLIGLDPTALGVLNRIMDRHLKGHAYVKSPIDMACWDILGKAAGLSVSTLLGGRQGEAIDCYRAISLDTPERMAESAAAYRAEGYRRFQLKVGSDVSTDIARIEAVAGNSKPGERLVADANGGWLAHEALRVVDAIRGIDIAVEQPCLSYEENLGVRRHTPHPFVLDESIDSPAVLIRALGDRAMDVVNIKISKYGGLTISRQMRDMCVAGGVAVTIEDSGGSDIVTAAITHLAHSTPEQFRFNCSDCNSYLGHGIADGAPRRVGGRIEAPDGPGLGVSPEPARLGDPVMKIE